MGIILADVGVGALIGPPFLSALIAANWESYVYAQTFQGTALLLDGVVVLLVRGKQRRQDEQGF